MATQYRQIIMDSVVEEYGFIGEYLPRLISAMDRIPDAVIEYCMSVTDEPHNDDNMLHLLIDECPENIVTMLIEVDEYDDNDIQRTSVRNTIALCLYIMYTIAMNVPNHPHRHSNWLGTIQRYAKNGDIHKVMSRIVNSHMTRHVDRQAVPIDEEIEHTGTPVINPDCHHSRRIISETSPIIQLTNNSILQPLYDEDENNEQYEDENDNEDDDYQPDHINDGDDEDANQNLPEDIEAIFRFDNFYDHIMQGIDRQRSLSY